MGKASVTITVLIGIITLVIYLFQIDERYAKASELAQVSTNHKLHMLESEYKELRARIWDLEKAYSRPRPLSIQKELYLHKERILQINQEKLYLRGKTS